MLIGYARVSTADQYLGMQEDALKGAGCEDIFKDIVSGAKTARPGLHSAISHLRKGDTLVVWRLDRLGRYGKYIVAGSNDGYFSILDCESNKQIKEFKGYNWVKDRYGIQCASKGIMITLDSQYFITVANCKTLKMWEMETGRQVGEKKLPAYPQSFCSLGEKMFLGFDDGSIKQFTFTNIELSMAPQSSVLEERETERRGLNM